MKLPAGYVPGEGVYKATAYGGFGERLLKRMGWEEGRGLGINQHGLKKVIEVKKKEDRSGVGGKAGFAWEKKWWEEAYESKLQKLQAEDYDSDSSDDELTTFTNRDGTQSSATAAELKLAAQLSKDPWGRFGGRAGKLARIRAQEAETLAAMQRKLQGSAVAAADSQSGLEKGLEALLISGSSKKRKAAAEQDHAGAPPGKAKKSKAMLSKQACEAEATEAAQNSAAAKAVAATKSKKGKKAPKVIIPSSEGGHAEATEAQEGKQMQKARVVHVVSAAEAPALAPFEATPRTGWWGARRFASAGCLEGLEHTANLVAKQRQTFTEQTQEDLYTTTQAAKSANKKGLGTSSDPRKVGGTSWKGQKTVFAEDEHEQKPSSAAQADANESVGQLADGQSNSAVSSLGKAKWKKIARQLLEQAQDGTMEVRKLQRKALKHALSEQIASKQIRAEAGRALLARLEGSKSFIICGDKVRLEPQK